MTLQDSSQAPQREHCDLLVIGAGQGGGPLAGAFARAGRRVVLVERTHVGGTCINEGCSPTKTIIASARVAHLVRLAREYGVLVGDTPGDSGLVDLTKVRARKQVQVLYLILAIAVKTMSNYSNHLFDTPVDSIFKAREWSAPRVA